MHVMCSIMAIMNPPNYYLDLAIDAVGSVYKLSKATGIHHFTIYRKRDQAYNVGEDMFNKFWQAILIAKAAKGRIQPENLCQKTGNYQKLSNVSLNKIRGLEEK